MTKNSRLYKALPLLAVLPLALAACGGGDTGAGSSDNASAAPAASGSLEAICEAAAAEDGEAIWYESSLPEQTDEIIATFNETHPEVGLVHQRVTGGAGIGGMVIQELQAGGRTADVFTGSPDIAKELADRGHLLEMNQEDLGITDPELLPQPYAMLTTTTVPVLTYNTNEVSESEVSGTWEDLTDPKWDGKIITWNRAGVYLSNLVPEWGEEQTGQFVEDLAANNPVLSESTFDIAQQVGAGTSPIGVGFYHTTVEIQETGAPIEIVVLDPAPLSNLYSSVVKESPNPMSAQCFMGWLATEEGALAYEGATLRGNYLIEATETAKLVAGVTTSTIPFDDIEDTVKYTTEFNEIIAE